MVAAVYAGDAISENEIFERSADPMLITAIGERGLAKRESHGAPHVALGAAIKTIWAHYIAMTK